MARFTVNYSDSELVESIQALTQAQVMALRAQYSESYLKDFIQQIKEDVANAIVVRVRSKIALTFLSGFGKPGTEPLPSTIYATFDGDDIVIRSTSEVMNILNAGFEPFDMKAKLMGRTMPIRLPGGKVIWRVVGDQSQGRVNNLNTNLKTKKGTVRKYYNTKNWIHPGIQGKHIYQQVGEEIKPWIKEFVRERINSLLTTLHTYARDDRGRFTGIGSSIQDDWD